jgi:hypothetical protein
MIGSGHSIGSVRTKQQIRYLRGRSRYPTKEWALAIAALGPRQGAVIRQCRRAFIARNGLVKMTELEPGVMPAESIGIGTIGRFTGR